MNNIWYELASFSTIFGNIPHNILLSSEDKSNENAKIFASKNDIGTTKEKVNYLNKREKYKLNNFLPTFGYIRNHFNVNKIKNDGNIGDNSGEFKRVSNFNTRVSRNDLEAKLTNKIQELKKNSNNKKNKQNFKKLINKKEAYSKDTEINNQPELEQSFEFGRILDSNVNSINKDYLKKKESKIKKINQALRLLKKEEEMLQNLPQDERELKIKEIAMEKAMKKAQGIKVKDNKSKLIKSKKQIQAKKKKSKKRWNEIKSNRE